MTTPKVATVSKFGSRFYVHPETGERVPGVTSIVGMLPKPFLAPWNGKMAAEYAVENLELIQRLVESGDRQGAIDLVKGAARRSTREASDLGTAVHGVYERMLGGETLGPVPDAVEPFVRHLEAFLDEFSPEVVALEETVWSTDHAYAGSFDALLKIGGEVVLFDWKTTKSGVYPEVGLQMAAYRHARNVIDSAGNLKPLPKIIGGAVLHVRPEGWNVHPIKCDEKVFDAFLHLRAVFDLDTYEKNTFVGNPVNENPARIGRR